MGIEDAGTITWLLKKLCIDHRGRFDFKDFSKAIELYEKIRIPRTEEILDCSKQLGELEERRGNTAYQEELELMIQGDLAMHGTLPIMFQGSTYNYKVIVEREIRIYEEECEKQALDMLLFGVIDNSTEAPKKEQEARDAEENFRSYELLTAGGVK